MTGHAFKVIVSAQRLKHQTGSRIRLATISVSFHTCIRWDTPIPSFSAHFRICNSNPHWDGENTQIPSQRRKNVSMSVSHGRLLLLQSEKLHSTISQSHIIFRTLTLGGLRSFWNASVFENRLKDGFSSNAYNFWTKKDTDMPVDLLESSQREEHFPHIKFEKYFSKWHCGQSHFSW